MDSSNEEQRILDFINQPGFQFRTRLAILHAHRYNQLGRGTDDAGKQVIEYGNEINFLTKFELQYEFYRFVRKRQMATSWYWNQVKVLTYLVILDLLHPAKAFPTEAERINEIADLNGNDKAEIPVQNFQRVRRTYPELFFKPVPEIDNKELRVKDGRMSRYSTIFSEMSYLGPMEDQGVAQNLISATYAAESQLSDNIKFMKEVMASFRMVDVWDLRRLKIFWGIVKHSLEMILNIHGQESENAWLIKHLKEGSTLIEAMLNLIDQAVTLQWYRKIKTSEARERIMKDRYYIRYSDEEAAEAVKLNMEWFNDETQVVDLVLRSIRSFRQYKIYRPAISILSECLAQLPLDAIDRGLCYNTMAQVYQAMDKPRKALSALLSARENFEEGGSQYDVGITWAHLSKIYHILGDAEKEKASRDSCDAVLKRETMDLDGAARAYIHVADCAHEIGDSDWESEASITGLKVAYKARNQDLSSYFNQRLTALENGMDTLEAESRHGSFQRPIEFHWANTEGSYIARSPKKVNHTNNVGGAGSI